MSEMTAATATAAADDALVQRHYPWVRAAAMRQVRDPHVADDVAQAVFIVLMRKKPAFASDAALTAWLFQTMRYAAAHALRSQRRRAYHEAQAARAVRAAAEMRAAEATSSDEWGAIAPLLDESVARLRNDDRQAVLLRFYQQKTFGDVGAAMGISEEAARKRVTRAVDKLRDALTRRGVAMPAATALASTLMTHATPTIPVAQLATSATVATAGAGHIAKGIAMTWTPAKIAAVVIVAAFAIPAAATLAYLSLGSRSAPPPAPTTASASPPDAAPAGSAAAPVQKVSQTDPIIPDDLLNVAITDLVGPGVETIKQCRVDPDSNITQPLVGAVNLKSMTLRQAELAVQKAYADANLMPNANIKITRIESGKSPSIRWARVGVGDLLRIEITDLVGPGVLTTLNHRVPDSGQITLPQAGPLKVQGLTEAELEKSIQELYRLKNLMPNAQIHVERIIEQAAKGPPAAQDRKAGDNAPK